MTSWTMAPILRTARLVLRRFEVTDVADALAYRNDAEFARYLSHIPQPFTRRDAEAFVHQNMTESWATSPTYAVVLDGRLIGTVNLEIDAANKSAMIGYAIAREHWGRGIATEAATSVLSSAVHELGVARIWATTDARNVASRRVLEKIGMRFEGVMRSHQISRDGARADQAMYGALANEITTGRSQL